MHGIYYRKHSKKHISFFQDSVKALGKFKDDVNNGLFPKENNSFEINEEQFKLFKDRLFQK